MKRTFHHPNEPLHGHRRHRRTGLGFFFGLMILLGGGATALAQTADDALRFSQRSPTTGATMTGHAGTGGAGVADFGAFYTNPAGLGYFESSQITGSFGLLSAKNDVQYDPIAPDGLQSSTQTLNNAGITHAGLIYKYPADRGSLVFGAGFNQTATFNRALDYRGDNSAGSITDTFLPSAGSFEVVNGEPVFDYQIQRIAYEAGAIEFFPGEYEEEQYPFLQAVAPGTTIRQDESVTGEGRLNEFHLGGAWQAASNLMAGLSLNLSYGSHDFSRLFREDDVFGENIPEMYNVIADGQTLRGFQRIDVEERISADLRGIHLRTGISVEPVPLMRIGITVETPTVYSISERYGTRISTEFVEGGRLESGSTDAFEFDYRLRTPWRIGAGIHLDLAGLIFMTDMEYINWTQLEFRSDDADFETANRQMQEDFNATVNWRGGIEWPLSFATFRGGIAWHPDPRNYKIELPGDEMTDRSKTFLTLGASVEVLPLLRLDVSWMQERFADQYRPYADLDEIPGEAGAGGEPVSMIAPFVDEELRRSSLRVGFSYHF